ncbi:MAG: hypothetical protein AAB458_01475 [Patescibacteria group bacterium]
MQISFPAFALFQTVTHKGEKQLQFRPNRKLPGNRTLIVIPDQNSLTPLDGVRIPIVPGNVLSIGAQFVLVTCFVDRQYSFEAKLEKALMRLGVSSKVRLPKSVPVKKEQTGRFVTDEPPAPIGNVNLDGPNMLPMTALRDLNKNAQTQNAVAKRKPIRSGVVSGIGSKSAAAKKNKKK